MHQIDEPTTGLHFEDIRLFLNVLEKLADRGNSVLVTGHNPDVIKTDDYIVDMGLEGGEAGGEILFAGSPYEMSRQTAKPQTCSGKYFRGGKVRGILAVR